MFCVAVKRVMKAYREKPHLLVANSLVGRRVRQVGLVEGEGCVPEEPSATLFRLGVRTFLLFTSAMINHV